MLRCVLGKVWLHFLFTSWIKKKLLLQRKKRFVFVSVKRTQSTHKTVTRGPWLPQKGAFGTSGVTEDCKVGPHLFLRESQRHTPLTTKKAQNCNAWPSPATRGLSFRRGGNVRDDLKSHMAHASFGSFLASHSKHGQPLPRRVCATPTETASSHRRRSEGARNHADEMRKHH